MAAVVSTIEAEADVRMWKEWKPARLTLQKESPLITKKEFVLMRGSAFLTAPAVPSGVSSFDMTISAAGLFRA